MYSAVYSNGALSAYHYYLDKYVCFNCGRLFGFDSKTGIFSIPNRNEVLPYMDVWKKMHQAVIIQKKQKPLKRRFNERTGNL